MKNNCCFIVASMDSRIDLLNRCVDAIKASGYCNADVFLFFQGTHADEIQDKEFFKEILQSPNPRGVFTPRYECIKQFGINYDFSIIIDDDLFMYPDTSYESAMDFLNNNEDAGCVCIGSSNNKRENKIVCFSDSMEYYNICGGLVLPKRSMQIILDYFKDKEADYTEDMFWLLLYVKGYDLWKDYSSNAVHVSNYRTKEQKQKKEFTGYAAMRIEKPYLPILQEYFSDPKLTTYNGLYDRPIRDIKSLKHINANGLREREKNYGTTKT